jgi:uncharacterized Zn finger protein (UPF0148 family)
MDVVQNYKCPCCTAPLVFDAETQNLICESCDNTFPKEHSDRITKSRSNSTRKRQSKLLKKISKTHRSSPIALRVKRKSRKWQECMFRL